MQKGLTEHEKKLGPKCRTTRPSARVVHSMKLLQKCLIYLGNWTTKLGWCIGKGGHFSVITIGDGEPKKFLVALGYLSYPPFVRLLEAAEKEFGFEQQGVLALPCEASVLLNILSHVREDLKNSSHRKMYVNHYRQ